MAHYYDASAKLIDYVPNASKPGLLRPTTSADARKLGLYPSVTTILSELNKPMVNDWRVEQGILAALEAGYSQYQVESNRDMILSEIREKAENYLRYAQDMGIAVHQCIDDILNEKAAEIILENVIQGMWRAGKSSLSIQGMQARVIAEAFLAWATDTGFVFSKSERTFVNPGLRYAGTIDLLGTFCGEPMICDVKTRDGLETTKSYYPDQALQLSGYALGIESEGLLRISVLVDRQVMGLCDMKIWKKDEVGKFDKAWVHLKNYFLAVKNL